jgi:dienelactone hydrolase
LSRARRLQALSKLTSANAIQERQKWARETLHVLLGGLPSRTDLNARVTGTLVRDGYRVDKVRYESRPGFHVSANLYVPTGREGPFPGVLFQMGHADNGKAGDTYQAGCQGLAKLGFLVLGFDPMGQGERIYYPDLSGHRSRLGSADEEHSYPGRQMLLVGSNCMQMQLWDAIRSLDYLYDHPLVDRTRIASTGQSGGATLTMLLAAVDDRLSAAAVFSGNTENVTTKDFLPPGSTDDAEQDLVGAGPLAFDRWDLLYPFAPKPLLISISDKDFFGTYSPSYVSDSWEEYQRLQRVYRVLGKEDRLAWSETPLPHGLSYDSRLTMYNWLIRHLQREQKRVEQEPEIRQEPDQNLWVSATGNMVSELHGETPYSLTKSRCETVWRSKKPEPVESLLKAELPATVKAKVLKTVPSRGGVSIDAIDIPSAPGVSVPAWLFRPSAQNAKRKLIVILSARGRNSEWHEPQLFPELARRGFTVCAADVRGIGDLAPAFSSGAASYEREHQEEENYAWSSLILGRPLVGQRVTDAIAVVRGLKPIVASGVDSMGVAALGTMTVPAIFAASLEPSIGSVYLAGGLLSYRSLLGQENYRHTLANFVPNILAHTDLPEMVALLPRTQFALAGMLDGNGAPAALSSATEVYRGGVSKGHVHLRERPDWNADSLESFFSEQK